MVGSYQHTAEFQRAGLQGGLTGEEEVKLTLTLLLDSLFFQALDGFSMQLLKQASLRGSPGLHLPDGHGAKSLGFLDGTGADGLCLLDGCGVKGLSLLGRMGSDGLSFLDGCGTKGFGILGRMGTDGLSFLDRFHGFRIILTKSHAELPN